MRSLLGPDRLWRLGLCTLFGVAAAWRFAYLGRLRHAALSVSLDADARIYWDWSDSILRHGLAPASPFFLAPLYPYVLAAVRAIGGGGVSAVLTFQALLGGAAVVLLADATARVAGRKAALAVGILLALSQGATFFDGLVLPESLLFFVESVLVWFVARTDWSLARVSRYAAYGFLVGVLAQGRASNCVLLLLLVPLVWAGRTPPALRVRAVAIALAAFSLCGLPAMLANGRASGELIPFTYNFGFNLYVGNNPDAEGAYVDVTGGSMPVALSGTSPTTGGALDGRAFLLATEGRRLTPAGSSTAWARKALAYLRAAPLAALGLAGRKLLLAWNHRAIPQIESMATFARVAGPLGLPVAGTFGFLAILGLSGAAAAAAGGGAVTRWLVGYLVLLSLAMVPFFVTDRYRHHLIPALAVLAGVALTEVARVARRGSNRARLRTSLTIGCAVTIVFAPIASREPQLREWAVRADDAMRLLDRGRTEDAARAFARAERALANVRADALSMSAKTAIASFYLRDGIASESLGRHDDAIARWERAIEVNPNDALSLGRLQLAYERQGRAIDAARVRGMLESAPGGRGVMLLNDGWSAAGRGDLAGAERLFLDALQATPGLPMAWEGLIRLRIQGGRYDEAARALGDARGAGMDGSSGDVYESFLAAARGDLPAARRALARVPSEPPLGDPVLVRLLEDARRRLDTRAR